jgi:hypothetical protein
MTKGTDKDWLTVFMSVYKQARPTIETVAKVHSADQPPTLDSLVEGYKLLPPVLQQIKGMPKPSNKKLRKIKDNPEKTLEMSIKAGEMALKMIDDDAHGARTASRMHLASIVGYVSYAGSFHKLVKEGLTKIGVDIRDRSGLPSVAEIFGAVAMPKITEGGGLFRKKYVRLGSLFLTVGGWMFQAGGTLGYGLRDHPVILGKLLGVPADRANEYVQNKLREIAATQLALASGKDKTLADLFLFPTLAQSGYELTPAAKFAKWINIKVHDMEKVWGFAQTAFQKGVAISFHFPRDFRIYWTNTFKPRSQKEWDEAYRLGIVTTQQQDILILEDEASNALAGAIDWVRTCAPAQLTSDELSILEKLASSQQPTNRNDKDTRSILS